MKIPEWLPDTYHPKRIDQEPSPPMAERLVRPIARFMQIEAAEAAGC